MAPQQVIELSLAFVVCLIVVGTTVGLVVVGLYWFVGWLVRTWEVFR